MHDGNDLPSDDHDCYVCSRDVDLVERCELISDRSMPRPKLEIAPKSVGLVRMVMNATVVSSILIAKRVRTGSIGVQYCVIEVATRPARMLA